MTSPTTAPPSRGRLPVSRRDRRPTLAIVALLLILLGALGSALVAYRSGDRISVLVAARDIPFGTVVGSDDFLEVRAAADTPGMVLADRRREFEGLHTTTAIPEGALVHPKMFSIADYVPDRGELVGIVVDSSRRPDPVPRAGQVVRIYYVAAQNSRGGNGAAYNPGETIVEAARIVSVGPGTTADSSVVTVLVTEFEAGGLANFASSGNVALTLLPDDTEPPLDTVSVGSTGN